MGIISVTPVQTGLVGVLPSIAYINTDDTKAEILATGYLNGEVSLGLSFTLPAMAIVITKATATASAAISLYQVSHVGANWSLLPLPGTNKFAAQYTTTGGAAAEAITINGLLSTDLVYIQMVDNGTNNVTVVEAVATADTLTITFSGDPSSDTIINYFITTPIS